MEEIKIILYNENINFEEEVFISPNTNTILFLSDEEAKAQNQYIKIDSDYIKWISKDKELIEPFDKLSVFLDMPNTKLIELFLKTIILEDSYGYKILMKKTYDKESDFLNTFKKYMKDFIPSDNVRNIIAPDILTDTLCQVLFHNNPLPRYEIPEDIIPYILNIDEVMPENPPVGFNSDIPYETNTFGDSKETESFFEKFNFLKPKD